MDRLTRRLSNGDVIAWNPLEYYNYNDFKKVLERLAAYEDLEEQEKLIELPCRVGTYLWIYGRKAIVEEFFGYETERYLHCQFFDNFQYIDVPFDEVGETALLTEEKT